MFQLFSDERVTNLFAFALFIDHTSKIYAVTFYTWL